MERHIEKDQALLLTGESLQAEEELVTVYRGCFRLATGIGAYRYDIETERADSDVKILGWVLHLTEKRWFTRELARAFILAAKSYHGISRFSAYAKMEAGE